MIDIDKRSTSHTRYYHKLFVEIRNPTSRDIFLLLFFLFDLENPIRPARSLYLYIPWQQRSHDTPTQQVHLIRGTKATTTQAVATILKSDVPFGHCTVATAFLGRSHSSSNPSLRVRSVSTAETAKCGYRERSNYSIFGCTSATRVPIPNVSSRLLLSFEIGYLESDNGPMSRNYRIVKIPGPQDSIRCPAKPKSEPSPQTQKSLS